MRFTSFWTMVLIYAIVIAGSVIYFVDMQKFGAQGMMFEPGGRDSAFDIFDMLILITLPVAVVLFVISAMAFRRKGDIRLFLVSLAFFFFLVKEVLGMLHNCFPREFIFIGNAERGLEFLILLSFVFLMMRFDSHERTRAGSKKKNL